MKKKALLIAAAIVATIAVIMVIIFFTRKPAKIDGFEEAVSTIDELEIPAGVRIVALGEAAHGNREFQELKLDVFRELVKKTNVRALILEGEFGGCTLANDYIQGGEGDATELAKHLGYGIYRTDQMRDLIQWMHDHNETVPENDRVRLYGMDIQDDIDCMQVINSFYSRVDESKYADYSARLLDCLGETWDAYDAARYDEIVSLADEIAQDIRDNMASYSAKTTPVEAETAERAAIVIRKYLELYEKEGYSHLYRDTAMKENVDWILGIEERDHDSAVMIACHNGHMTRNQSSRFTFLGKFLAEEYGDSYYAIGTDFYYSTDNLPYNGGRITETLCSDDPLAYQVKDMPENRYLLDFNRVDPQSSLGKMINRSIKTGSIGEYYNPVFKYIKGNYQISFAPTDMYDAMILYYEVSPTTIWGR